MRFLDLNRYSLLSFTATLTAIAYSSHRSLFNTPSSLLNLGLLKSLEPILKDVIPFSGDWDSASGASFILNDLLHYESVDNKDDPSIQSRPHDQVTIEQTHSRSQKQQQPPPDFEHSRLLGLGGAAGVGTGFRPSVFQAMLAERYLKFRTPSPAVLLQLQVILSYLQNEKLCVLVFTNMAFCLAFLAGRLFLRTFFGDLRVIERQHMYDRALNFLLFKVVFVGAILEPRWEELLIWTAWFTILGFLRVFSMLCRDRFEYITVSPNVPVKVHVKILTMLAMILVSNIIWFILCISVFRSMLLLLSFECFTLLLDTLQTTVKYIIHLGDLSRQGPCESRRTVQYYTEFVTDSMILVTTLGHYLHIMYLHGISFTLIDAVLFLNMRSVFNNLRKKISSHQTYRQALRNMRALYPSATAKQLADYSDDCAICRDSMSSGKVLPCGHIFHLFCIRSWLEHHSSCPTCRRSLSSKTDSEAHGDRQETRSTPMGHSQGRDREDDRNGLSQRRDLVSSSAMSGSSTSTMALTSMGTPSGSSTATSSSAHSGSSTPVNPSGRSRAAGHQLFAFNSEQQPWLTRLGFPRITLEVVDRAEEGEEEREEDTRNHGHHYHHGDGQHTQRYTHPSQPPTRTSRNETSRRSREIQESIYSDDDDEYNEELARALRESLAMHEMLVAARETASAEGERGIQEPELERGQEGESEANMRRRHYPSEHLSLP
ncbi:hypothetical protein MVEG_05658 [Podila verticillata NRRL 6337]|nr:hypothetical protein MVEG_05658 [Podila verticillata NRRL 6337]